MINEIDEQIVWARCRSGKKWFWCVWILFSDTIIAHGKVETVEECKQQAMQYRPLYEERAGFAENRRKQIAAICRQEAATSRKQFKNDAAIEEFVFVPSYDSDSGGYTRHRIVKRTKTKIFVEKEGEVCRADGQLIWRKRSEEGWRVWSTPTIALDRELVEQEGRQWHRGTTEYYWESMERWQQHQSENRNRIPDRLIERLGLSRNSAKEEAREAFKKLLAASHPDRGGSSEVFQQLNGLKQEYPSILS